MVGAGRVAAHADSADEHALGTVERESAAEYVDPADSMANHRIVGLSEIRGGTPVRDAGVDRVAVLQSVEGTAGLHGGIEIGGRQSQARQAERVGGIGFLR